MKCGGGATVTYLAAIAAPLAGNAVARLWQLGGFTPDFGHWGVSLLKSWFNQFLQGAVSLSNFPLGALNLSLLLASAVQGRRAEAGTGMECPESDGTLEPQQHAAPNLPSTNLAAATFYTQACLMTTPSLPRNSSKPSCKQPKRILHQSHA